MPWLAAASLLTTPHDRRSAPHQGSRSDGRPPPSRLGVFGESTAAFVVPVMLVVAWVLVASVILVRREPAAGTT